MKFIKQTGSMPLRQLIYCESIQDIRDIPAVICNLYGNDCLLWYRGVSKASYRLKPTIQRGAKLIADQFGRFADPNKYRSAVSGDEYIYLNPWKLLSEFKNVLLERDIIGEKQYSDVEILFLGQHYRLPTPLLDWTEDYHIALWFATGGAAQDEVQDDKEVDEMCELSDQYAAIYILPPADFNKVGCAQFMDFYEEIVDTDIYESTIVGHYLKSTDVAFPVAIKGKPIDNRLINQKGNFTIHGYDLQEIDYLGEFRKILTKIIIPGRIQNDIRMLLGTTGIDEQYVYGCHDFKDDVGDKIKKIANEVFEREYPRIQTDVRERTLSEWGY